MPVLTKTLVDRATYQGANGRRCVIWDEKLRGFGLRIFPSGHRAFVLSYRPQGSRAKKLMTLGAFGEITVDQARKKAQKELAGIRDGGDPLAERGALPTETVKDLCTRWMEEYAKLHRKAWKECQYHLDSHIVPALGSKPAIRLTAADVRRLHAKLADTPVQANRIHETLRAVYNWALRWEILPAKHPNPCARIDRFRTKSRERWLTPREVMRLAAAVNRETDPHVQAAFRLLLLTGCRKTELLRARWDRMDRDGKRLLLEDTKTGEPKVMPLSKPALEVIDGLPRVVHRGAASPWLFPSPKGPSEPLQDLKRPWERIRKRAKIPDARIHDLRRTAGSWMIQAGVPLKVVGQALGHRDDRATQIYARIAAQQPAEALELLGEALSGAVRSRSKRRKA